MDFTYTGRYRVNTSPKQSVTASFTVVDEDEYANSVSRFIEDVRLIDDLQIIFCEDGMNRCAKAEVDTGRASGWRHIQPTVLNLEDMTVSGGEESYYSSANGATWMSNKFTTTGTCRRL